MSRNALFRLMPKVAVIALLVLTSSATISMPAMGGLERRIEDASLSTQVKLRLLHDKSMDNTNIDVDVTKGVVYLKGQVNTAAQKSHATALTKEVEGVGGVVNQLAVTNARSRSQDSRLDKVSQNLNDDSIAARIRLRLLNSGLTQGNNIHVNVLNHEAMLTGTVSSESQRAQVTSVTQKTSGVKKVINNMKVSR